MCMVCVVYVCVVVYMCGMCFYEFECGASSVAHSNTNTEHTYEEVINTNSRTNICM